MWLSFFAARVVERWAHRTGAKAESEDSNAIIVVISVEDRNIETAWKGP
jgi:hypothetical protein